MQDYISGNFFANVKPASRLSAEDVELMQLQQCINAEEDPIKQAQLRVQFLEKAVVFGKNIIIAGETGSGKTTFMKTLMQSIPTHQRLITIEDVPELMWGLLITKM